jgi:hypothetical protein
MTKAWSAYVELQSMTTTEETLDEMADLLTDHYASIGYAPNGNLSVQLSVDAATARQAIDDALKAVTRAARDAGGPTVILGVELLTVEEQERRLNEPAIPELIGLGEIAEMFVVSRQRAGQVAAKEGFPPAVARLKAGPVFVADQVRRFAESWKRDTGRPRAASRPPQKAPAKQRQEKLHEALERQAS